MPGLERDWREGGFMLWLVDTNWYSCVSVYRCQTIELNAF